MQQHCEQLKYQKQISRSGELHFGDSFKLTRGEIETHQIELNMPKFGKTQKF